MGKNQKPSLGVKFQNFFGNLHKYWNKAPAGRYLSLKEATAYCVGGMGAVGATVMPVYVTLTAGSYIAAALEINVDHITLIGIITSIITILRAPLYSMIIDNTHTKYGKFRPYLIWMPIPIILSFFAFGFLDQVSNYTLMLVLFTIIFNVMQFFMGLYALAFTTLLQVISPKQSEKEWLMGFGAFVYSLGPSIVHAGLPLIANLLFTINAGTDDAIMGINTIGPYKWLVPLFIIICFALGYWTAFGTKERIVQPKEYKQKIKFVTGIKNTSTNKYFWLNTISNILGVFKLIGSTYVVWLCSYAIKAEWAQSVFTTIINTAYTPGMLLAPILIKKFGKKNLTIFSNLSVVVMTIPMIFVCIKPMDFTPYLILILSYFIILVNSIQVVTVPAITTQIYDYQQYKTGDRLEGFINQYGVIIGTLIGMATAFICPAIYKHFGYSDDTKVLAQASVLYPIIGTTCILGAVSGVLGTIPFFFWDLTEKRHTCIIEVLKVRALKHEGKLDDETADSIIELLEGGDEDALNNYLIEHPVEGDDFISVKKNDDGLIEFDDDEATCEDEQATATDDVVDSEEQEVEATCEEATCETAIEDTCEDKVSTTNDVVDDDATCKDASNDSDIKE